MNSLNLTVHQTLQCFWYSACLSSCCPQVSPTLCNYFHLFIYSFYLFIYLFDIHVSVHRKYISKVQPTRCNVFSIYLFLQIALHVSGSSSTHHREYKTVHTVSDIVKPILLPAAIVDVMELSSISSTRKCCILLVVL